MNRWISTKENLPEDGQTVLIFCGYIDVARFERGISKDERNKMKNGEIEDPLCTVGDYYHGEHKVHRSKLYGGADEDGNNAVPYRWYAPKGPMSWFGQEVSHWMYLPDSPQFTDKTL